MTKKFGFEYKKEEFIEAEERSERIIMQFKEFLGTDIKKDVFMTIGNMFGHDYGQLFTVRDIVIEGYEFLLEHTFSDEDVKAYVNERKEMLFNAYIWVSLALYKFREQEVRVTHREVDDKTIKIFMAKEIDITKKQYEVAELLVDKKRKNVIDFELNLVVIDE